MDITINLLILLFFSSNCDCYVQEEKESSGILGQMRHYLGELGSIASEVGAGVQKLSRQIRSVEEFLDATVDEDCYFQCPKGS
jgi:hypothetical protein